MVSRDEKRLLLPALVILAVLGLFFGLNRSPLTIKAETGLWKAAEDGVLVVPIQIERDRFGIAIIDPEHQTMWLYGINSRGPAYNRLELLAARSWRYDRLLQQYNTAEPRPEQVRLILEKLGQQRQKKNEDEQFESEMSNSKENEPNTSGL